jgi:hypothetical protein
MSRNQMTFLILGSAKRLAMGLAFLAYFYAAIESNIPSSGLFARDKQ